MIKPESVNISALPSVLLEKRSKMPSVACIYFAIDSQGMVQYIGKTGNLRKRWANHHRQSQLLDIGDISIAYLELDESLLKSVEVALIAWFDPPLNRSRVVTKNFVFKIQKDVDAPNLPLWLSQAVERSSKKPEVIAVEAGISAGYLYRLMRGEQPVISEEVLGRIESALGESYKGV